MVGDAVELLRRRARGELAKGTRKWVGISCRRSGVVAPLSHREVRHQVIVVSEEHSD